jgi:hypothetical protein
MPKPIIADAPDPNFFGWIDAPERHEVAKPLGEFADLARPLMGAAPGGDALLYKAWKDVLGKYPDYVAQQIGDCESMGNGHGTDLTECIQIALSGTAESYEETGTEALYAMGREAGNMLGRGDGCYGSAMAKALTTMGGVPRKAYGAYSGSRAKEWGRTGAPAEIKKLGLDHKMGAATLVSTLEELDAALDNAYVVPVSSNQGFTMTRDQDGFCSARGSWSHCMLICARRVTGRKGYLICQSWGPTTPSGPLALDQPPFSFWVEPPTIARMLGQRDSFALSKFQGYPGRPLPSKWTYAAMA